MWLAATTWYSLWVVIWSYKWTWLENISIFYNFLILKFQDLVFKVIYSSSNIKSCYPELVLKKSIWNSLQNICGIFLKIYSEIKLFQVYSLQWVPVFCIKKWYTHSEIQNAKKMLNTFNPVDSFFLIIKFTIFLLINFFLYIFKK